MLMRLPQFRLRLRRRNRPQPDAPRIVLRWDRPAIIAAQPVAVVAAVAGAVSYSHIVALGLRVGQDSADAHLLPVSVDGLIIAGSVIIMCGSLLGWVGVVLGVAATLFANVEAGLPHGALSAAVSAWPAFAFTCASFMLERWLKSQAGRTAGPPPEVAALHAQVDELRAQATAEITGLRSETEAVRSELETAETARSEAELRTAEAEAQTAETARRLAAALKAISDRRDPQKNRSREPKPGTGTGRPAPAIAVAKAREILAADPDIAGAKLGELVGRSGRWGEAFKKEHGTATANGTWGEMAGASS
jgi:hypothetical protein